MIDLFIIFAYFIITLIVGIRAGKNTTTMADFSVARRNYNTTVMVATTCATLAAAENVMYASQRVFEIGILYAFVSLALPLSLLLVSQSIVPRFAYVAYKKCLSVGDLVEAFYGQKAKVITGLAATLFCIGAVGGQVCAIGYFCDYFLGLPHFTGILLGAGIVTVYSAFGGIKSVTITDVIQFAMLVIIIPITASVGVKLFGWNALLSHLPKSHLSLTIPAGEQLMDYVSLFIIFLLPGLDPALVQRFLMSRDSQQMQKFMRITALLGVAFLFCITMIGLTVLAMVPNLEPSNVFPYFINQLLPTGLRGFAVAGMLAVIMSTADSFLNTGSICFVHDFLQPLFGKQWDDARQLKLTRYVTVLIGLGSILASLTSKHIMEIILIFCNFWMPVVTIPLYLTLWGFKGTTQGFIAASLSGLATALGWMLSKSSFGFGGLIPAMGVNLVVFVAVSYFTRNKPDAFIPPEDAALLEEMEV